MNTYGGIQKTGEWEDTSVTYNKTQQTTVTPITITSPTTTAAVAV